MPVRLASHLFAALAAACAAPEAGDRVADPGPPGTAAGHPAFELSYAPADDRLAEELGPLLAAGARDVEAFFALPYREPFRVELLPDRAAFDASFPPEWGVTRTQCWMVATGVADALRVLSPRVWGEEACEHDPDDAAHVRGILVHELVHVLHGQHNPRPDFAGLEELAWLLEGLAVYASGQLEEGHLAEAAEAVELGLAPERLEDAWSGKYRYGVSGSLVRHVDETLGRETLRALLEVTTEEQALGLLGVTEQELLASWEAELRLGS